MSHVLLLAAALAADPQARTDRHGDPLPAGAVARVGTVRLRNSGAVERVALTADGRLLATAGSRFPVRVWDAATGALVRVIPGPVVPSPPGRPAWPTGITAMVFPADSRQWLYVLTDDGILRECDVTNGAWSPALARTGMTFGTSGPSSGRALQGSPVSPDRTRILYAPVSGRYDGIEVFAVGKPKPEVAIQDPTFQQFRRAGTFTADNRLLAVALRTGVVKVWDTTTGQPVHAHAPPRGVFHDAPLLDAAAAVAGAHTHAPRSGAYHHAAISPDGKSLAAVYEMRADRRLPRPPGTLVGLDRVTGRELFRVPGWESSIVTYTPDGSRLVGFAGSDVLVADSAGKLVHRLRGHGAAMIHDYSFSADGTRLATAGRDHTVIVWDLTTGKPALDFDSPRGAVDLLTFSPDGKTLFAGCTADHAGGLWDAETGARRHRLLADGKGNPLAALFTPDGRHVVVGYTHGYSTADGDGWAVRHWDVKGGQRVREFSGRADIVLQLAVSPDGKRLMTRDRHKRVGVWDLASGAETRHADWAAFNGPTSFAWPKPGELIGVRATDAGVEAIDLAAGKPVTRWTTGRRPTALAVSPDGRTVLVSETIPDRRAVLRDVANGAEVRRFEFALDTVGKVAFSPDGRTMAVAESRGGVQVDGAVHLYDVATGERRRTIRGHAGMIAGVAFSPDGKRLATGGWDSTALVWDLSAEP